MTLSISRMPGPAGRALVAHDEHVARLHDARAHGVGARLLAVEDPRRPACARGVPAGELHQAAVGREVAAQRVQRAASA